MPERCFTVDVDVASHDELKAGYICSGWYRFQVAAVDEIEAVLVATQMAACVSNKMPTAHYLCV